MKKQMNVTNKLLAQTTIGALATAAHCFGVCLVKAEADQKLDKKFQGIENHYVEIPVNIRQRIDPPLGLRAGFYVTEVSYINNH